MVKRNVNTYYIHRPSLLDGKLHVYRVTKYPDGTFSEQLFFTTYGIKDRKITYLDNMSILRSQAWNNLPDYKKISKGELNVLMMVYG